MFGFVMADGKELSQQEKDRYGAVYCGICRRIRLQSGHVARLGLSYDMAFLALLLMSLLDCHFFNIGPTLVYSIGLAFAEKTQWENRRYE